MVPGVQKTLYYEEDSVRYETSGYVESYSVPVTADALGRTKLSIKKWIRDGIIPPPVWRDTSRNFLHYTVGELSTIARVLAEHESSFVYLSTKHTSTIEALWEAVRVYRSSNI